MDTDNNRQIGSFNNPEGLCSQADTFKHTPQSKQENTTAQKPTKKKGPTRRNRVLIDQTGNQTGLHKKASRNLPSFPDSQTKGRFPHGVECKKAKSVCCKLNIQNGKPPQHTPSHQSKRLGSIYRSSRCLSSRPNCSLCTTSLGVCSGKQNVPVSGPTIRPQDRPPHIYTNCTNNCSSLTTKGHQNFRLSGRLARSSRHCRHAAPARKSNTKSGYQIRISYKPQKVPSRTYSMSGVLGCRTRPKSMPRSAPTSQNRQGTSSRGKFTKQNSSTSHALAPVFGSPCESHRHSFRVQEENEANPNSVLKSVPPTKRPYDKNHYTYENYDTGCSLVAQPKYPTEGKTFHPSSPIHDDLHRCVKHGMGCSAKVKPNPRVLGRERKRSTHKHFRNAGSTKCTAHFQKPSTEGNGPGQVRQSHSSILLKQTRGHKVKTPVQSDLRDSKLVRLHGNKSGSLSHTRKRQLCSRFPVKRQLSSLRVATKSTHCQTDIQQDRTSPSRPVCIDLEQAAASVLHKTQGSSSSNNGCLHNDVEQLSGICISPLCSDSKSTTEGSNRQSEPPPDSPMVAEKTMVPHAGRPPNPTSNHTPRSEGPPPTTRDKDISSQCGQPKADVMAHFREIATQAGLSGRTAELSSAFLRSSTRTTYDSRLQYYFKWCSSNKIDPTTASLGKIAEFLVHLFDKNLALSTIRGYRSAISAIHRGFEDGLTVGSSTHLSRLMKSLFLSRPPQKKLSPSWSLSRVLRALSKAPFEPMHSSPLANLTTKTTFLIAIACGRRRSFLHALSTKPGHVRWETNGVRLIPHAKFVAKNQTMNSSPSETFIPSLKTLSSVSEDKLWCPVRALKWYLHRTKDIRTSDNLFVSINSPHGAVSPDTISRWIVQAIKAGGMPTILTQKVRAHDTRGMASSWALFQGVPLADILKAAYWHNPNTFTSCYLSDVLSNEAAFASAVLSCPSRK